MAQIHSYDASSAEAALVELQVQRAAMNSAKREADKIAGGLRAFHEENPDAIIFDGERNLKADFSTPNKRWVDLDETSNDLLGWMAEHGMLTFKMSGFDTMNGTLKGHEMDAIKKMIHESEGTTRVSIVKADAS